jgi:hypothetical protein
MNRPSGHTAVMQQRASTAPEELGDYFARVWASDVHQYGANEVCDFLGDDALSGSATPDWVITNPPFKIAAEFVRIGLKRSSRGVAMLLRIAFLEGQARHALLYGSAPVSVVAPFSERVPMVKGRWDPNASSATAYAWFIWLQPAVNPFRESPVLRPIAPGAKARLTRPDDVRRFGDLAPNPLFDGNAL